MASQTLGAGIPRLHFITGIKDLSEALINALKAHLIITDKMTT